MAKNFVRSIGGGHGSAPIVTHSIKVGGGKHELLRVSHAGEHPSEPPRPIAPGPQSMLSGKAQGNAAPVKDKGKVPTRTGGKA